jgi:hypothetical protein
VGAYVVEREMDGSLFLSCVLIFALFISPCQKQCELLPSLTGVSKFFIIGGTS